MASYQVKLINDRALSLTVDVLPKQPILDALEEHGIQLPNNLCRQGNCLFCIGRLVSGKVEPSAQDCTEMSLQNTKFVLLCAALPCSNCTIVTRLLD